MYNWRKPERLRDYISLSRGEKKRREKGSETERRSGRNFMSRWLLKNFLKKYEIIQESPMVKWDDSKMFLKPHRPQKKRKEKDAIYIQENPTGSYLFDGW